MADMILSVSCPRCSFQIQVEAQGLIDGPVTRTCTSCGLIFRVGTGHRGQFESDPTYETTDGWYARKEDGTVLYFPNLSVLRQWATEGTVSPLDQISKTGSEWKTIKDLPEIAALTMTAKTKATASVRDKGSPGRAHTADYSDIASSLSGSRTRLFITLIFLGGVTALLAIAKPWKSKSTPEEPPPTTRAQSPTRTPDATEGGAADASRDLVSAAKDEGNKAAEDTEFVSDDGKKGPSDGGQKKSAADGTKTDVPTVSERKHEDKSPTKKSTKPTPPQKTTSPSRGDGEEKGSRAEGRSYDRLMERGNRLLVNKPHAAKDAFMKALSLPGATSEARAKLGRAFLRMRKYASAVHHLERALRANRRYRPALWDLAEAYTELGNKEKAVETYRKLVRLSGWKSRASERAKAAIFRLGARP